MQKQGIEHGRLIGGCWLYKWGGAAVACAKVGQVKIRLKTHDVAGGLGEGSFNRGGGGFSGKKCYCGGARADFWVSIETSIAEGF